MSKQKNIVKTGFDEIDEKLRQGGMIRGTVCSVTSDPDSPWLAFLFDIYKTQIQNAYYITPTQTERKIKHTLENIGENPSQITNLAAKSDIEKTDDIKNILDNIDYDQTNIVIMNGVSELEFDDKTEVVDFYTHIADLAIEENVVVIFHTISGESESYRSEPHKQEAYIGDVSITLKEQKTPNELTHTLYLNRIPVGQRITENKDKRVLPISDSESTLEISGGGKI